MEQAAIAPSTIDELQELLAEQLYITDRGLAISIFLALKLGRPLFLEGEAGVGKTEVAKVLASGLGRDLIRLQCYEGLDVNNAVYEWNYARQLLEIRVQEAAGQVDRGTMSKELFTEDFLIKRPLLQAIEASRDKPPVLLIDEIDRADEEFEGFLLELLSDFQITIPEIGTFRGDSPPIVVITSNRTREVHDALKRRCLYFWIDYPDFQKEQQIVVSKMPDASRKLAGEITGFVQELRDGELYKVPGVAETLDWTAALVALNERKLDPSVIDDTLGILLKYHEDIQSVRGEQVRALLNRSANRGTRRGGRRGLTASVEQVGVGTGPHEYEGIVPLVPDQQPVRADMAFPESGPPTRQPVRAVARLERLFRKQLLHHGPELIEVLPALRCTPGVLLELRRGEQAYSLTEVPVQN